MAIPIGIVPGVLSPTGPTSVPEGPASPHPPPPWLGRAMWAEAMKPLGNSFIETIEMAIAPIVFRTIVRGIASMRDMEKVGRAGLKWRA